MLTIRRTHERGYSHLPWLESWHTFSFANYHDPKHMGFHHLRVINQDIVQPGEGFATHSHHDMEIITYVLQGRVEHKDSMGNSVVIRPGEIQRMSAGTGISHSEYNPSTRSLLELLQIWIVPAQRNLTPSYQQISFTKELGRAVLLASPTGEHNSIRIHQNVKIFCLSLAAGQSYQFNLHALHSVWVQIVSGEIALEQHILTAGDGAAISQSTQLQLTASTRASEALVFVME